MAGPKGAQNKGRKMKIEKYTIIMNFDLRFLILYSNNMAVVKPKV